MTQTYVANEIPLCPNLCYTRKYGALRLNLCYKRYVLYVRTYVTHENIVHYVPTCVARQNIFCPNICYTRKYGGLPPNLHKLLLALSLSLPAYLNDPNLCSKRNSFVPELMLHTKIWCITAQLMLQTICALCPNLCYTRKYSALCPNLCFMTKHLLSEHMLHTKIWWFATQSAQAVASSRSLSLSLPT